MVTVASIDHTFTLTTRPTSRNTRDWNHLMPPSRPYLDMITRTLGINAATALRQGHSCKLCGGYSRPFDSIDFFKYCSPTNPFAFGFAGIQVEYRRCQDCGFLFTDFFDEWTPAEFASYVYNADYPRVDSEYADIRPHNIAAMLAQRLAPWADTEILDYGSGSGAFSERMAAHGFGRITNYDPFSSPARPERRFPLITCFEVIEHTVSPQDCLRDMAGFLAPGGAMVFSQPLQPPDIETIRGSWWYIGPRNGHASIFTADALSRLAGECGLVFHQGDWLHGFAPADATGTSRAIRATIGAPCAWVRLEAPLDNTDAEAWHAIERHDGFRYRWTRASRIAWRGLLPPMAPLRLRLAVPFVNQIRDGFAAACRLEVGGQTLTPTVQPHALVAETTLVAPADEIVLRTPAPVTPRALRGAVDDRPLGVAIGVYPWVPVSLR
jgi:2-polyprenyl-6-hydroxyphenyl methylase/3-demethylubiquinone-9 3-methyltransferase